ncbi:hypothetical protein PI125_g15805 [Phytophthora idaei]|nr:hypothetical protein PI125_g15805 [Phytophthora idaei]
MLILPKIVSSPLPSPTSISELIDEDTPVTGGMAGDQLQNASVSLLLGLDY